MGAIKRAKSNAQLIARYRHLYDRLLTAEEKKHLILLIHHHQPVLVGRDDLKRRLAENLFRK